MIVYLSAFSLFIRTLLKNVGKKPETVNANAEPAPAPAPADEETVSSAAETAPGDPGEVTAPGQEANTEEGGTEE